jgi:arsenite-transporting ATPase
VRVLLVVGKGGVGKTTLAAATALASARDGRRTLVVSTDPAHSLTDALGLSGSTGRAGDWRLAATPVRVDQAPGHLDVLQIDTRARLDLAWETLRRMLGGMLEGAGIDPLVAEEIATVPGVDDVLALLEVGQYAPAYDAVVIDCAPTAETLRLLALPEALDRLVSRSFPLDRRIARLVSSAGMANDTLDALEALDGLARDLMAVRELVTGPQSGVRLVTTPERLVLAESHRARATLAMLGHHVEGVVVNRVAAGDDWPAGLVARHREGMLAARDQFGSLPVRFAPYTDTEPIGVAALLALADAVLGSADPLDLGAPRAGADVRTEDGQWLLDVPVPGADPDDVTVGLTADGDLVVDLGPHRRVISLPSVLRRCEVDGASIDLTESGQVVRVRFRPDEDRWTSAVRR